MDELKFGTKTKRGDFSPKAALAISPLWSFPPQPLMVLKWLPGYFLPWNLGFFLLALIFWNFLAPDLATMKTLAPGWIVYVLVRNAALVLVFYGALELRLYIRRRQGSAFKFNAKFPADVPSDTFLFNSQTIDSVIRTFGTGVPIWTAYEVVILWVFANQWVPWLTWADNKWYLIGFGLILPLFHELHFYCIHRLIHVPVPYKWVHSVHHNSVNPSPWSSLSMHPVEHLL